jgi:hypothetical protein
MDYMETTETLPTTPMRQADLPIRSENAHNLGQKAPDDRKRCKGNVMMCARPRGGRRGMGWAREAGIDTETDDATRYAATR